MSSSPSTSQVLAREESHFRGCACDGRNLGSAREWLAGRTREDHGRSVSLVAADLGLRGDAGKKGFEAADEVTVEFCNDKR